MFYVHEDKELLIAFEKFIKKQFSTERPDDLGVDFTQDAILFGRNTKYGQLNVLILNLLDENKFDKNAKGSLLSNQSFKRIGNLGIITTLTSDKPINQNLLAELTSKIDFQKDFFEHDASHFIHLNINNHKLNSDLAIQSGFMDINVEENIIDLNGDFKTLPSTYLNPSWSLASKGFHVEAAVLPENAQNQFFKTISQLGINMKSINHFAANYHGMEIQENDNGIFFSPMFDVLITFKDDFILDSVFKVDNEMLLNFGLEKLGDKIHSGKYTYQLKAMDSKTLFIGLHSNLVTQKQNKTIFALNGDIGAVHKLNGGGFINSVIGLYPPFKATKLLGKQVENLDINSQKKGNKISFNGKIKMKSEAYTYNELLRFYLAFKGEI